MFAEAFILLLEIHSKAIYKTRHLRVTNNELIRFSEINSLKIDRVIDDKEFDISVFPHAPVKIILIIVNRDQQYIR